MFHNFVDVSILFLFLFAIGLQIQTGCNVDTIEQRMMTAMHKAGAITDENVNINTIKQSKKSLWTPNNLNK
jgi:hypothetical protein